MLGLLIPTDPRWIDVVLERFDALLLDHFHCELKAASNALALVTRYPQHEGLVRNLAELAREESEHALQVHAELQRRNVVPTPPPSDPYAAALRHAAQHPQGNPLLDRLLVGALIEARSCERFSILKEQAPTEALRAWYEELFASEARHHRLFTSLAEQLVGAEQARERWTFLAEREAELVRTLPLLPQVH